MIDPARGAGVLPGHARVVVEGPGMHADGLNGVPEG